jgi:hypothetical protein
MEQGEENGGKRNTKAGFDVGITTGRCGVFLRNQRRAVGFVVAIFFPTGPSVETLRNQRQAVEGSKGEGLHHGSLCGIPKKPTSGRGGLVTTGIRGYTPTGGTVEMRRNQRQAVEDRSSQGVGMLSPTGATVEMRRNQRQAVVSVVCTGGFDMSARECSTRYPLLSDSIQWSYNTYESDTRES